MAVSIKEMMTEEQAAEYLGKTIGYMRYMRTRRKGPAFYYGPTGPRGGAFYLQADIDSWLSQTTRVATTRGRARQEAEKVA